MDDALIMDLHFEDEDGNEVEINGKAKIELDFVDSVLAGDGDASLLHIKDNGDIEDLSDDFDYDEDAISSVTFTTTSFSEFAILRISSTEDEEEEDNSNESNIATINEDDNNANNGIAVIDDEPTTSLTATSTTDLETYLENKHSGKYTLSLSVKDSDGNEVSGTELSENTTYQIQFSLSVEDGFDIGTYTYQLPTGINYSYSYNKIDNIGTYEISSDGLLTLDVTSTSSTDVEINFGIRVTFDSSLNEITIGNTTYTIKAATSLNVNKTGSRIADDEDGLRWTIVFSMPDVVSGTVIRDVLSDSSSSTAETSHWYSDDDMAAGITFTVTDGTNTYTWTATSSTDPAITWSDSNNDGYYDTWTYTMPEKDPVTGTTLESNWKYTITYTTTRLVPDEDDPYYNYHNTVTVTDNKGSESATDSVSDGYGGYDIVKSWKYGDDNLSVDWTITATIPSGSSVYRVEDIMQIINANSSTELELGTSAFIDSLNITVTIDGKTYTVYAADSDEALNGTAEYVYAICGVYSGVGTTLESSSSGYKNYSIVLGSQCTCDDSCSYHSNSSCTLNTFYVVEDVNNWWYAYDTVSFPTGYCACWNEDYDSELTITYTTSAETMATLMSSAYAQNSDKLWNYAKLEKAKLEKIDVYDNTPAITFKKVTEASVSVPLLMASKTYLQTPNATNDWTAGYQIVLNEQHVSLTENNADLYIYDTLSESMSFENMENLLTIVSEDKLGNEEELVNGVDYTCSYDTSTHQITIILKDPGTKKYTITYYVIVTDPAVNVEYENSVSIEWMSKTIETQVEKKSITDYSSSGKNYSITIHKTDKDSGDDLTGVTFGLYNSSGVLKSSKTTNTSGNITFETISGTGSDALRLENHTLYYIQEIQTLTGYKLDTTPYYFYFCDNATDHKNCSDCKKLAETINESLGATVATVTSEGIKITNDDGTTTTYVPITSGITIELTNEQLKTTDVSFVKVKGSTVENDNGIISNTPTILEGATFAIYETTDDNGTIKQSSAVLNNGVAYTVTSDSSGKVTFEELSYGETYWIEEISTDEGYQVSSWHWLVTINNDGTYTFTTSDNTTGTLYTDSGGTTYYWPNYTVYELPKAGGIGIHWLFLRGVLLMISSTTMWLYRYRRREREW